MRTPEFAAHTHRQSAAIAVSEHEVDDQGLVDVISIDWSSEAESAE
ncbi:MAG: antitoxin MazE family protein [Actinomycetota bacterium]|nr:antitoxin MazE family protein [Actinomycetota bacterium]